MTTKDNSTLDSEISADSLFDGKLTCLQYVNGYRFSIDAILLAHFFTPRKGAKILDAGTGSGVIPLILMYLHGDRISSVDGLEIQPDLVRLAVENFKRNGFENKCRAVEGDISSVLSLFEPEIFDHIYCNPPFYKSDSGRQNLNDQARIARHQISATIDDITAGCAKVLKNKGDAIFIYPAEQMNELFIALAKARLMPKQLQIIYSYPAENQTAKLMLVHCKKNGGQGLSILPPFYVYSDKDGTYSEKMRALHDSPPDRDA